MRFLLILFRFIWRMFWRLVWAGIVAFIILVSVLYLTNPSQTGLTAVRQAVQTAVNQLDTFLHQLRIHTRLGQNVQNL